MRHAAWLLVAALVLAAGCQKSTPAAPDKAGSEKSTSTAAEKPAGKACTIAHIRTTGTNPYLDAVEAGARQKSKDLGVTLDVHVVTSLTDTTAQADWTRSVEEMKFRAIVIGPDAGGFLDIYAWPTKPDPRYPLLRVTGIPSSGMGLVMSWGPVTGVAGPDQFAGAKKAGDYACDLIKKRLGDKKVGNVLLLGNGTPDSTTRMKGLEAAVKAAGLNFAPILVGDGDAATTQMALRKILADPMNLDGLLCTSDKLALDAALAVEARGKTGQIILVGYGNTEPVRDAMKRGQIHATIEQNPAMTGAMAVECAVKAIQGEVGATETLVPVELVTADQVGSAPAPTTAKTLPKGG
jgi:ABC-type sugar transport system substrate-binding protein